MMSDELGRRATDRAPSFDSAVEALGNLPAEKNGASASSLKNAGSGVNPSDSQSIRSVQSPTPSMADPHSGGGDSRQSESSPDKGISFTGEAAKPIGADPKLEPNSHGSSDNHERIHLIDQVTRSLDAMRISQGKQENPPATPPTQSQSTTRVSHPKTYR